MDLGSKILNNLISKDFKTAKAAAQEFVESADCTLLKLLDEKGEFLFDFIKEKILKNLIDALNEKNAINVVEFAKFYSFEFKEFILTGISKFNLDKYLLKSNNASQNAYLIEYFLFKKNRNEDVLFLSKKNAFCAFEPLKIASIRYLSFLDEREEYQKAVYSLKNGKDEIEKLEAVEFLSIYGDKNAVDDLYEYFIESDYMPYAASNLIALAGIEGTEDKIVLRTFGSILTSYPDEVQFDEINCLLNQGVFDLLVESQDELAPVLLFYLRQKIEMVLSDENYSIDLTKNQKQSAGKLFEHIKIACAMYDEIQTVKDALFKNDYFLNKIALETACNITQFPLDEIKNLFIKTGHHEIIVMCAKCLFENNALDDDLIEFAKVNVKNEIVLQEILSLK